MTLSLTVNVGGNYVAEVRNNKGVIVQTIGPNTLRPESVYVAGDQLPCSITERPATALEIKVDALDKDMRQVRAHLHDEAAKKAAAD